MSNALYDVNRVPAAIRNSEATTRNLLSHARYMILWTAWRVDYDHAAQNNCVTGRRAHRA